MSIALEQAKQEYQGHPTYFAFQRAEYQRKRDLLVSAVAGSSLNLRPIVPEGGMFLMVDTSSIG
jgi:DNA-binding transcriptional MocR family regulator